MNPIKWTWYTKDSVSPEERERLFREMKKPEDGIGIGFTIAQPGEKPGFAFEDNKWAVCQPCHELILDGDLLALVARNAEQFAGLFVFGADEELERMVEKAKSDAAAVVTAFWFHRERYEPWSEDAA